MKNKFNTEKYYTPIKLNIPADLEKIIEISRHLYETKSSTNEIFVGSLSLLGIFFKSPVKVFYSIMISSVTAWSYIFIRTRLLSVSLYSDISPKDAFVSAYFKLLSILYIPAFSGIT